MAREAIESWLNTALDAGQPIPKARTLEEHMADPEYKGWAWGVIEIDLADFDDTVERINITVPRRVLRQIDKHVAVRHENRSGFLARAALEAIYEHA